MLNIIHLSKMTFEEEKNNDKIRTHLYSWYMVVACKVNNNEYDLNKSVIFFIQSYINVSKQSLQFFENFFRYSTEFASLKNF